jgi:hypothetical protein
LRAVIANADGKNARDCAIVDISAGGAQIALRSSAGLRAVYA